ncbi:hypothetical protein E3N88_39841 [Mikania micrantha]|uniref:MULE transposase domain-containing protein n=1 Tax=Mikania micrantha TaxID=192012 RepID=A0A5N6LKZ9_9ASTR|nr:hypothetical protein E3N88_39841 [Mikania micrantha]
MQDVGRVYRGNEIVKDISEIFKVNISYSQAWRAKSYALELLRGSPEDSFAKLPIYGHNLIRENPGTFTHIQLDAMGRFEMFFVAIGVAVSIFFINYLRPLIIIGGAHLKGKFKGTMFLVVAMDGNNQILPIAFGIGKIESGESWTWFLSKLKECIGENPSLSIVSDRAASIEMDIRTVFPFVFHGLCCRHLMVNLRQKSKKGKTFEQLWWMTCKAYRSSDINELVHTLLDICPDIYSTLWNLGYDKWSRAHSCGQRYIVMTSNSAESINALSRHARKLPITKLIACFREYLQIWPNGLGTEGTPQPNGYGRLKHHSHGHLGQPNSIIHMGPFSLHYTFACHVQSSSMVQSHEDHGSA